MELTQTIHICWHFFQPFHIGHITIGLYWVAHKTGQFQVPAPKIQDKKFKKHQIQPLSVLPPQDVYLNGDQA